MTSSTGEVHARHIRVLNETADWAALVRYWLVHGVEIARECAITLLNKRQQTDGDVWSQLAVALADSKDTMGLVSTDRISAEAVRCCTPSERITIELLGSWPAMLFLFSSRNHSPPPQAEQLGIAVRSCQQGFTIALAIGDKQMAAVCATAACIGLESLGQSKEALQAGQAAVQLREGLASEEPAIHLVGLAQSLLNLVQPCLELNRPQDSVAYARRAVRCASDTRGLGGNESALLAQSLQNLGFALKGDGKLRSANCCLRKAVVMLRGLPEEIARFTAALDMHVSIAESLGLLKEAELGYRELIEIRRQEKGAQDDRSMFVAALGRLAYIQAKQGRFIEALTVCDEASKELEESAVLSNRFRKVEAAFILHVRASAHYGLRKLDVAKSNCDDGIQSLLSLELDDPFPKFELAKILDSRSIVLRELGDVEAALADITEAAKILVLLPAAMAGEVLPRAAHWLSNKGVILATLGHWEAAKASFEAALDQVERLSQQEPSAWKIPARMRSLVSLSYVLLKLKDAPRALERSREALRCVQDMKELGLAVSVELHSLALLNEGNALLAAGDLNTAQSRFEEAIAIHKGEFKRNPDAHRAMVARLLLNVGLVSFDKHNRKAALHYVKMAVRLFRWDSRRQPSAWLPERLQALSTLGRLMSASESPDDSEQTRKALRVFDEAWIIAEELRTHFFDAQQLRRIQSSAREAHEGLMWNLIVLASQTCSQQPLSQAFFAGESSRARNLNAMLSEERFAGAEIPSALAGQFWTLRRQLRDASRNLHAYEAGMLDSTASALRTQFQVGISEGAAMWDTFRSIKAAHDELLSTIQDDYPSFRPGESAQPRTFEEIRSLLLPGSPTAFIQYNLLDSGCIALIVTSDGIECVLPKQCPHSRIRALASQWTTVVERCRGPEGIAVDAQLSETIRSLLQEAAQIILWPVTRQLQNRGIRRLVISQNRDLHLLPLNACPLEDGRPLSDHFEIAFTPSFSVLHHCAGSQHSGPRRLLVAANPTADLHFAELEGYYAQKRYANSTILMFRSITKARLRELAADCDVFHYTGHVSFDSVDPMSSALVLEHRDLAFKEKWLTLRELFLDFKVRPGSLAIANGCESGLLNPDDVDDYINLPVGFLLAGASCVLSTLWSVPDFSSALLMRQFHVEWSIRGQTVSGALQRAQRWLRDEIKTGVQLRDEIVPSILAELPQKHLRDLCVLAADRYAKTSPTEPPFASPLHWASYQAIGSAL